MLKNKFQTTIKRLQSYKFKLNTLLTKRFFLLTGCLIALLISLMVGLAKMAPALVHHTIARRVQYFIVSCPAEETCFTKKQINFFETEHEKVNFTSFKEKIIPIQRSDGRFSLKFVLSSTELLDKLQEIRLRAQLNRLFIDLKITNRPLDYFFYSNANTTFGSINPQLFLLIFALISFLLLAVLMILFFGSSGTLNLLFNATIMVITLAIWNHFEIFYSFFNLMLLFLVWLCFSYFQISFTRRLNRQFVRGRTFWQTLKFNNDSFKKTGSMVMLFFLVSFIYFLLTVVNSNYQLLHALGINLESNWFFQLGKPLVILFFSFFIGYFLIFQLSLYSLFYFGSLQRLQIVSNRFQLKRSCGLTFRFGSQFWTRTALVLGGLLLVVFLPLILIQPTHESFLSNQSDYRLWSFYDVPDETWRGYLAANQISFFPDELSQRVLTITKLSPAVVSYLTNHNLKITETFTSYQLQFFQQFHSYLISLLTLWIIAILFCLVRFNWWYAVTYIINSGLQLVFLGLGTAIILFVLQPYTNLGLEANLLFIYAWLFVGRSALLIQQYQTEYELDQVQPTINRLAFKFNWQLTIFLSLSGLVFTIMFNQQLVLIFTMLLINLGHWLLFHWLEQPLAKMWRIWCNQHISQKWQHFFQTVKQSERMEKEIKGIND